MIKNITEKIIYIGVDDTDIDLFESQYVVPNGVSYNSYLILDEKVAVMDTVDRRKSDEWLQNLDTALAGRKPDYLVIQHLEPDHAGTIAIAMERYPEMQVVASDKAVKMMPQFFANTSFEGRTIGVKEGDTLSLGGRTLHFAMAPMVHWPEVMVTYDSSEKVLFSADGFGKFGALCNGGEWACEARRYYFNICGKYGAPVQALLKKAAALDIEIICPLHGPVLTENLGYYIGLYDAWSKYEPETKGVLVAYASIHGNTAEVANKFAEILRSKGAEKVVVCDLSRTDMSEAVEDAFRYSHLVVAAASYDGDVFPVMHDFLHHLAIKNYSKRRIGIIENGSWAPSAGRAMRAIIDTFKGVTVAESMVTIMSSLKDSDIPALERLADEVLAE
ncbi:MAG: FprA family A-type flavoprotein [Alistipes sp.]|nr:FprA family A-type flavoprotein [Alistipes sp.]MBR3892507.1 FprA family A-type flavoprotein [Alistipes sp.]MBR6631600.1 FprA family A-type flavoprotein [Alistipes sp.]